MLCEMGADVFSIEYNAKLFEEARQRLHTLGYRPHLFQGDGCKGKSSFAPYAAILVTAAAPVVPPALVEQLDKGGRLVLPLGDRRLQQMLRITKDEKGKLKKECFSHFAFVPLLGEQGWKN